MAFDYDVIVIGSGFGGSVAAMRAVEKGYSTAVLEAGKRWTDDDLPKTNWNLAKFMWHHRVFGQPGLHIMDGSNIAANPGVNPSLSISALAERAMSFWPNKGEPDTRPPLGSGYDRIAPVLPHDRAARPGDGAPSHLRGARARRADRGACMRRGAHHCSPLRSPRSSPWPPGAADAAAGHATSWARRLVPTSDSPGVIWIPWRELAASRWQAPTCRPRQGRAEGSAGGLGWTVEMGTRRMNTRTASFRVVP